jgi:hypothetical protein
MLKSFRAPITLPTVVTNYYEPMPSNGLSLVGRNRAAHQLFVSHQVRLINTILGSLRGLNNKKILEIAIQNRMLGERDLEHLNNIAERLVLADLIDQATKYKLNKELEQVFKAIYPNTVELHPIVSH